MPLKVYFSSQEIASMVCYKALIIQVPHNNASPTLFTVYGGAQMHASHLTNSPPPIRPLLLSSSCVSVDHYEDWPLSCYYTIWCPRQLTLVKSTEACQPCHHCPLYVSQHSPNILALDDIPQMPRLDRVTEDWGWQVNASSHLNTCLIGNK